MDEIEWWEFDTAAEMAEQAAGDIGFVIESAVEAHGGARVALPGAEVPEEFYRALLKNKAIDWSKVTIVPTGDRLVRFDDPLSHHARLDALFGGKGATVISLVDEAALDNHQEAGRLADARLALLEWPLDLVVLGVGDDGHTAAIFPGPDLDRAVAGPKERRAVGLRPSPMPQESAVDRVTLTTAALASARAVMFVLAGDEKRAVLERAIKEGPLSSLPVGRVISSMDAAMDILWSAEA